MEDTIFTKIIKREIPAEIIYEDEHVIVIPDKFPSMYGQVLVITKEQIEYLFDMDDVVYQHVMMVTKKMATALDAAFGALRTCTVVEGFEVPHVHVRMYPCRKEHLEWERHEATDEELKEVAEKIRAEL